MLFLGYITQKYKHKYLIFVKLKNNGYIKCISDIFEKSKKKKKTHFAVNLHRNFKPSVKFYFRVAFQIWYL